MVSILTRPEGRVLLPLLLGVSHPFLVSILTRPEGRVLHTNLTLHVHRLLFQSSPDPKAGCYQLIKE